MTQRSLRVLQVTSTSLIGGAEQRVLNFVRHCDPARVFPSVLCLLGDGPLPQLADQAGAPSTGWSLHSTASPYLLRRMQLFLREGRFDLVQTTGLRADAVVRWPAQGMDLPVISSICSPDPWRRWYHVAADRLTADGATAWISTSEAALRSRIERERFPEEKITLIRTGIPDRKPPDAAAIARLRKRFDIQGDETGPVLAVVANLRPAKGHEDLIRAVAQLRAKWPGLVCLCAGRDDSGGSLQALATREGLAGAIRWLGALDDAPSLYDVADLAVLPSHWEGLPNALIEALRAGLASVATDVGGTAEVVRHEREGLLCDARSPQSLAGAIDRALGDAKKRREWGEAARVRYEECFRVEAMVERMTEVYECLCGRRPMDNFRRNGLPG